MPDDDDDDDGGGGDYDDVSSYCRGQAIQE